MTANAALTIGILIFDGVEELDFVGPWEVFTAARHLELDCRTVLIGESSEPVRCSKGMRVLPDHTLEDAPALDMVLVPGGNGTRALVHRAPTLEWLARRAASCKWVTSVCTGSYVLFRAGLARGRRVTTHWSFVEPFAEKAKGEVTVLSGPRYVRDGNVVTAAGVSAGIDMALWLIGQLKEPAFARAVQRYIEYDPAPPYAAEV